MSAYVESVLGAGENVYYRAAISHWRFFLSYLTAAVLLGGGAAVLYLAPFGADQVTRVIGIGFLAGGVIVLLFTALRRGSTEVVLTDRRFIAKRGIVSLETVEINLTKVESLHVRQDVLGRIFNYGDVAVVGTGASLEPLRCVSRPLELRKMLGELADVPILR
jgi:uncharacterized membrane protein YdbT with pleckstrin-like domain